MKWLIEEIRDALALLKRGETWLTLGLIAGFGLLAYAVTRFAFKTDSILRFLHHSAASCRELSNGPIIFLFCSMIFFALSVVVTFGEFQRYIDGRRRNAYHQARQAMVMGIVWGAVAIGIAGGALLFFNNYCR